ncbi:SDR family oxidoreductase [Streptomyces sp. NPDC002853]
MIAYGQSKTALILFAREAARRWSGEGITANAVNPGGIDTGLQRPFPQELRDQFAQHEAAGVCAYKTVQQGAATTLVAAVAPEFANTVGHYLDDAQEAHTVPNDAALQKTPMPSSSGRSIPQRPRNCGPSRPTCCAFPPESQKSCWSTG